MRVPPDLNLVRVRGLGLLYSVPRGFGREVVRLRPDSRTKYLVRRGYRLAPCPSCIWSGTVCVIPFESFAECPGCAPFHDGVIAVQIEASALRKLRRSRLLRELAR